MQAFLKCILEALLLDTNGEYGWDKEEGMSAMAVGGRAFNVTNGDVFTWPGVYRRLASDLGMRFDDNATSTDNQ